MSSESGILQLMETRVQEMKRMEESLKGLFKNQVEKQERAIQENKDYQISDMDEVRKRFL